MHKQTKHKTKSRNWTEIAQDIGHVLRKQIMDRRMQQLNSNDLKQSAIALTRSIIKASNQPLLPVSTSGKILFQNKRLKTQQFTLKYARQTYLRRKDSAQNSHQDFQFQHNSQKDSRIKQMQQNKKKEAHMLRTFLGRLRQERQFSKLYNQREKSYKIWRQRADKVVASNALQK